MPRQSKRGSASHKRVLDPSPEPYDSNASAVGGDSGEPATPRCKSMDGKTSKAAKVEAESVKPHPPAASPSAKADGINGDVVASGSKTLQEWTELFPQLQRLTPVEKIITHGTIGEVAGRKLQIFVQKEVIEADGIALRPLNPEEIATKSTDIVFLVKWRGLSHLHCRWVTSSIVACEDPHGRRLAISDDGDVMALLPIGTVRSLLSKPKAAAGSGSEDEAMDDDDKESIDDINTCPVGDIMTACVEMPENDPDWDKHISGVLASLKRRGATMQRNYFNSEAAEDPMQLEEVTDMQQVERIVAKKSVVILNGFSDCTVDCVLVKWQGLGYDCCSWEWACDPALPAAQYDPNAFQAQLTALEVRNRVPSSKDEAQWRSAAAKEAAEILKTGATTKRGRYKKLEPDVVFPLSRAVRKGEAKQLRSYQMEGVNWLLHSRDQGRNVILADEMGLGKTAQIASLLEALATGDTNPLHDVGKLGGWASTPIRGPFLIIAPLSTLSHWQRELAAWTSLNAVMYHGNATARDVIFKHEWSHASKPELLKFDVVVTTPDAVRSTRDDTGLARMKSIVWQAIIVDEAHCLKDHKSLLYQAVLSLKTASKILLTGTPIQNSQSELWSLLHFLHPDNPNIGDLETWLARFATLDRVRLEALTTLMASFLLRRSKATALKSLPPLDEMVIWVEMTPLQKIAYRAIYEQNAALLMQGSTAPKGKKLPSFLNVHMELRKCCNHPFLVHGVVDGERDRLIDSGSIEADGMVMLSDDRKVMWPTVKEVVSYSGKMLLLEKLLPKLKADGHKVLIFSQFKIMLDLVEEFLASAKYPFERIDGSVTGMDRQAAIDRFNGTNTQQAASLTAETGQSAADDSSSPFVFLLTTKTGGVGINLQAADTVILFDSDWNPQNDIQAQARCHRIGQDRPVRVYRLITARTYEQEMLNRAGRKLGTSTAMLKRSEKMLDGFVDGSSADADASAPTDAEELEALLKNGAFHAVTSAGDDAIQEFCDADITTILERRVQRLSSTRDDTSTDFTASLSAASFTLSGEGSSLSVDDPNFWESAFGDVVRKRAQEQERAAAEEFSKGRVRKAVDRFAAYVEGTGKPRKPANERSGPRRDRGESSFVMIDAPPLSDEDYDEVEDSVEPEESDDPDIRGELPVMDETGRPLPKIRKILKLYDAMLMFGVGRWDAIRSQAALDSYPPHVVRAYCYAIVKTCAAAIPDQIQAEFSLREFAGYFEQQDAAEALELVPKEVFSEKWLATFREEYLAVFTRLRMLKDLAVFVETCSIPRILAEGGDVLSQSSFIAPHVRSSMKSCPSWKMSRDRDALLLAGVYKHGWPLFRVRKRALDPVFSAILNDPALPFFPKTLALPIQVDTAAEVAVLAEPPATDTEMDADAPLSSPTDPPVDVSGPIQPSNKDLDDRIRDLLKGLARERFNAERQRERQAAMEEVMKIREAKLAERKKAEELRQRMMAIRKAEAKMEALRREKKKEEKRRQWSESEIKKFTQSILKTGEPWRLLDGRLCLDWLPMSDSGESPLVHKAVRQIHVFYASVWTWVSQSYPISRVVPSSVVDLAYIDPEDSTPRTILLGDVDTAAEVAKGVEAIKASKPDAALASKLSDAWNKRLKVMRAILVSGSEKAAAACRELWDSDSPATKALVASCPWWHVGLDDAALLKGLYRHGCGDDALKAIWTDAKLPFAGYENVVDKSYMIYGQAFYPKAHLVLQLLAEISSKL